MEWKERTFGEIMTTDIIFFDEKSSEVCTRICDLLSIDVFPSYDSDFFHLKEVSGWKKEQLLLDFILEPGSKLFESQSVLDLLLSAPSNVFFIKEDRELLGIVHFTDYARKEVYQDLYNNLFVFENEIRNLLTLYEITYSDFEKWFHIKSIESDFYRKRYEEVVSDKFKSASKKLPNLQKLYLTDLLGYCMSSNTSYFEKNGHGILPSCDIQAITTLRNTIMHSVDISGSTNEQPHNIGTFSIFFKQVLSFKIEFLKLRARINGLKNEEKKQLNNFRLLQLKEMDDKALRKYFFTYR